LVQTTKMVKSLVLRSIRRVGDGGLGIGTPATA
jgi:hypothetical protein